MFLRSLSAPLTSIRGIGPLALPKFARLGIHNVQALLQHYPRDWEDRSRPVPIKNFQSSKICTIVTVVARDWIGFGRTRTLKVYVEDESSRAALLCFNRPWLEKKLVIGEKFRLWGRFYYKYSEIQSSSFEIEHVSETNVLEGGFNSLLPVYPLTSGLTQAMLRRFTNAALNQFASKIEDEMPARLIERDKLLSKAQAIKAIHFPTSSVQLELAKKTIICEELFYLEIMVAKRALERKGRKKFSQKDLQEQVLQKRLLERLPFKLTGGQRGAVEEINADMQSNIPMARLLQGDVGSGKTLVSFLAALRAVEQNGQCAIMAPTELLARQHAENAAHLLEPLGIKIAFLTGNIKSKGRKELLKNLAAGNIDIVVGTHALFSKDVQYKSLKLVVIDEQHRFGVTQRSLIMSKGEHPHLLMMSATPIPRTLALTVFGDMDVSVIKDMPPGRKPVKTHLAKTSSEGRVYK
jgi:ATP-dependent DNA helicase RecG